MSASSYLLLFAGGLFGGFYGSTAGSAGLVSLPILLLLGLSPAVAVATSRPAVFVMELVSALRFGREHFIDRETLRRGLLLGIAGAIGAVIGTIIIVRVSDQVLRVLFAAVITTMSLFLLTKRNWGEFQRPSRQKHIVLLWLTTLLTGIYGGFFGFTFGTMIMLVLVVFGYSLLQSAALGRIVGTVTALAATAGFAAHGMIDYPAALALAIGFGIGAWFGAGAGVRGGNRYIKALLTIVVLASVAKLLWDSLGR